MTFYNTPGLHNPELSEATVKAQTQQEKIECFFRAHPLQKFTPFQVRDAIFGPTTPVTSIRRAITDLTDYMVLVKTSEQVKERYGSPNYYWQLNPDELKPEQLRLAI